MIFTGRTQRASCKFINSVRFYVYVFLLFEYPSLQGSSGSKLVEGALGHPREDPGHGVRPVLRVSLHHGGHLQAVLSELSVQEDIDQVDIGQDVEEVHDLRQEDLDGPDIMSVEIVHQILGQNFLLAGAVRPVDNYGVEAGDDPCDLAALPGLAEEVRDVEETGLEEENKGNPLVVSLDGHIVCLAVVGAQARGHHVPPDVPRQLGGEGEGGHDVTVGVDHGRGDAPVVAVALHDAGDLVPVAHPVQGGDEDATSEQEESRDPVVQLRHHPLGLRGGSLKTNIVSRPNSTHPSYQSQPCGPEARNL